MGIMSANSAIVRYDGPAISEHRMDVADLAPALLGLSDLCKQVNQKFNGDRAQVRVLIDTDQVHQCFQFKIEIVQTIWQQAQALIANEDIQSAKDILEWIGMIGGGAIGGIAGLIKLLKWLKGRQVTGTEFMVKDGKDVVQIKVTGDNNNIIVAHRAAYDMLADPKALASAKKILEPLVKPGYDKLEFEDDAGVIQEEINRDDAVEIAKVLPPPIANALDDEPQNITAWVRVYSPVFDAQAEQWRFWYGDKHEYMDITETTIAADALKRGGSLANDSYKVSLEIQQTKTPSGTYKNKFKIKSVLEFVPAKIPLQGDLLGERADN